LEPVAVPEKRTVKFKVGRLMKQRLGDMTGAAIDDEAGDIDEMPETGADAEEESHNGSPAADGGAAEGNNAGQQQGSPS
jgi:hypothetical protein